LNQIISFLVSFGLPITRISKDFSLSRSTIYRIVKGEHKKSDPLEEKIKDIALKNPSFGYRRIFALLKQNEINVNHKKVYRIYTSLDLQRPTNTSKHIHTHQPYSQFTQPLFPGHVWSADFVERMVRRRKFRIFVIIDDFSKRIISYYMDFSISGQKVLEVFENSIKLFSRPRVFRTDNGSEFRYQPFNLFLSNSRIKHEFIDKGKPYQNGFSEGFNSRFSDECLKGIDFDLLSVDDIKSSITDWFKWYNYQRPHSAINYETPVKFYLRSY